jgi:hypothetical protein
VDNIKMDLREIGWGGMEWIDLITNRKHWRALVNTVINFRVVLNFGKFFSSWTTDGFSRRVQLSGVISLEEKTNVLHHIVASITQIQPHN